MATRWESRAPRTASTPSRRDGPGAPEPVEPGSERVLVHAPTGRDGALTKQLLEREGWTAAVCPTVLALCRELDSERGAGLAIIADEALSVPAVAKLAATFERQPPWSDLPVIVFTRVGVAVEHLLERIVPRMNAAVLERPIGVPVLRSAVQTALRARRRQYETRDLVQRLEEADRRKDEFMAQLGHELRTPLDAIRNAITIIDKTEGPARDLRGHRARAVIERQSGNLTRLIDDLLDVTRVTSGRLLLRRERVDLNGLVTRVVQGAEQRLRDRQLGIEVSLASPPPSVEGDVVRLEQVVSNLLHNAIKYTPEGGHVWISVEREGAVARLRVRDDGLGLEPALLPRLFVPFSQGAAALDRAQGGLGLGLALVRQLVTLHGGSVSASSPGVGQGATFEVRLPALGAEDVSTASLAS